MPPPWIGSLEVGRHPLGRVSRIDRGRSSHSLCPAARRDRRRETRDTPRQTYKVTHHGNLLSRPETPSEVLRQNPRSPRDAEPDRGSEEFLRPLPALGRQRRAAGWRRYQGRVPVGVPDQGLQRDRRSRVREIRAGKAEVRRRGMPAARHDLCSTPQGDAASDRVRCRRGYRREIGQGHQGTGRVHGRHAPDDLQRHVHRQRHRAGHRLPDAPLARRVLRP